MKNTQFIELAKQYLPAQEVGDTYENRTESIDDHWKRQIINWEATHTQKPLLEVLLTYSPDGFSTKSPKKVWNVFVEKQEGQDWSYNTPFRSYR